MSIVHLTRDDETSTINYHDSSNWEDLTFPISMVNPVGIEGKPDKDTEDGCLLFSPNSTEVIAGIAQMPHSWQAETPIVPHIHWQPIDNNIGNGYWRFEYDSCDVGGTFSGEYTTIYMVSVASEDSNSHIISHFPEVAMGCKKLSAIIKWRLARIGGNPLDTYGSDIKLIAFDIHYRIGSVGSGQVLQK